MNLKEIMLQAGIVGAGGAGFPSYAKLADGVDTLIINGAECEPLLYTDYVLLHKEIEMVLFGITSVLEYAKIPKALLCIKEHTAIRLNLKEGTKLTDKIQIKVLPDVYPMGDEISLIYQSCGRLVKPGALPITVGVIVYNVETVYNIAVAVKYGKPVTRKWLTIGGNVSKPMVVNVPIGTPIIELFKKNNIDVPLCNTVLDGGPSMGKIIDVNRAVVTKTTKGLLILPDTCDAVRSKHINNEMSIARAETACCQCTRCTDMCPRALLGYPLEPHKMVRTSKGALNILPQMVISATLCCGCGVCETLACCQGISPKAVINEYKTLLAKNKMRFNSNLEISASKEREYRKIPSIRWASALGVAKFDKLPEFIGKQDGFTKAEIYLKQHIGLPSVSIISDGQNVNVGEKIAESGDGLSLPQYASINGKAFNYNEKIVIEKVD